MNQQFSLSLVEKDLHGDYLSVWAYPQVALPLQQIVEKLVSVNPHSASTSATGRFIYTKVKTEWVYVLSMPVRTNAVVKEASLGVLVSSFNPEKWEKVLQVLLQQYLDNKGEPVKILEAYLSLLTQGKFGNVLMNDVTLSDEKAYLAVGCLKDIWNDLGFDTIILFNAMLLKKRILVLGDNLPRLLAFMRTIPQFVSHRKDWSILRPVILESSTLQLEDLTQSGVYVAGTLDARLATHQRDIKYDVLISMHEKRVTISADSMPGMKMCSFHKEVATTLSEMCATEEDETSNNDIILKLNEYTQRVITQVQSVGRENINRCAVSGGVSSSGGEGDENRIGPSTAQWMIRLADAEGL